MMAGFEVQDTPQAQALRREQARPRKEVVIMDGDQWRPAHTHHTKYSQGCHPSCHPTIHSYHVTPFSKPQGLPAAAGFSKTWTSPLPFQQVPFFTPQTICQYPMSDATDYSLKIHWSTWVYACDDNPSFHFFLSTQQVALSSSTLTPQAPSSLWTEPVSTSFTEVRGFKFGKDKSPVWNRLIIQRV